MPHTLYLMIIAIRAETKILFTWIFAHLHMYLNTKGVFECTVNYFSALILTYFVINDKLMYF